MEYLVKPYTHQLKAIEEARDRNFYGLFFEQGAGKSGTAINVFREKCVKEGRLLKTLIVTPLITLKNWQREIHMHSKVKDITILEGSQKQRLEKFSIKSDSGHVFIINHEFLAVMPNLVEQIKLWNPEFLIVDESHKFKDPSAKRTKQLIKLAEHIKYKLILTGTPTLGSPLHLFSQFRILCGGFPEDGYFEKNYFSFRARYMYDKNAGMPSQKHFPDFCIRPGSLEEINRKIYKHAMRVLLDECLDLPGETEQTIEVGMTAEQSKYYAQMLKDFITFIDSKACVANLALTKGLRLQQIASGFVKLEDGTEHKIKNSPRQEALKELLETLTVDSKVVVWATFRENYQQIRDVCDSLGLKYAQGHGDIPNKEKFENVDNFNNDPEVKVFIGNPQAVGLGINLVSANYSVFYSRDFSLGNYLQARSRIYRSGQTKKVVHYHFVSPGTIDEVVQKALANKQEVSDKVLYQAIKGMGNT